METDADHGAEAAADTNGNATDAGTEATLDGEADDLNDPEDGREAE